MRSSAKMPPKVSMPRFDWSHLNKLQVGRYAEYFVKMELTMHGFEVYASEVDDHGVDFVARRGSGPFLEFQVKSVRSQDYIFIPKEKAVLSDSRLVAAVVFTDGKEPDFYLIRMTGWLHPTAALVDRPYVGKKSKPEFGLNISPKHLPELEQYRFAQVVSELVARDVD